MKYSFGGEWNLLGRRFASGAWVGVVWPHGEFRLAKPAEALAALGDSVVKFSTVARSMEFQSALDDVMHRAELIRKGKQN